MSPTQKLVVEELKKIASEQDLVCNIEWKWANTGRAYFRKGFKTYINIDLAFNDSYMTAAVALGSKVAAFFGKDNDTTHYIEYHSEKKFLMFFDSVKKAIAKCQK